MTMDKVTKIIVKRRYSPMKRDHERGGGDDFCDEQQEDGEREEDRDTQRDLLTTIWREVEDQHGQAGDEQAGDDEVYGVEERQTADDEEVGDVWVDLMAAVVLLGVVGADSIDDGPLATLPVIFQVDCVLDALQVDLGFVVSPRAEFHLAVLLVKGEEGDIDAAWALVDGRWNPAHFTCVEEVGFGHVGHRKTPRLHWRGQPTLICSDAILLLEKQWNGFMHHTISAKLISHILNLLQKQLKLACLPLQWL